jgi:hypothetical protein
MSSDGEPGVLGSMVTELAYFGPAFGVALRPSRAADVRSAAKAPIENRYPFAAAAAFQSSQFSTTVVCGGARGTTNRDHVKMPFSRPKE